MSQSNSEDSNSNNSTSSNITEDDSLGWKTANSFQDLLQLSKDALIYGHRTLNSFKCDETDSVLVEESIEFKDNFIKMHDLGFMTNESQPGKFTKKNIPDNWKDNFFVTSNKGFIRNDITIDEYIHSQREYVFGLMEFKKAYNLMSKLKKYTNICVVICHANRQYNYSNLPTEFVRDINSNDIDMSINLTNEIFKYSINGPTNLSPGNSGIVYLSEFISEYLYNKLHDNIVEIDIIAHDYGSNTLHDIIIDNLKELNNN